MTVFSTMAGKTPTANSAAKGPGNPTNKKADPKKTVPETNVPTAVNTLAEIIGLVNFLISKNKPKKSNAVTILSIIFGICPFGNPVVNADNIPVTMPISVTLFISGTRIIPKNIMASIISGLIPRKLGMTVCKTTPIPAKSAKTTKFFVFNSHLSSAILSYLFLLQCTHCLQRKTYHHYSILR